MSLYSNMEICEGCLNAVWCTECGHFKYCSIGETGDPITGTCQHKAVSPQEKEISVEDMQKIVDAKEKIVKELKDAKD